MSINLTPSHNAPEPLSLESLPIDQQLAIRALSEGCNFSQSAEQAGVTRVTLWRWLNSDPTFAAIYEAWKQELAESARAKLLKSTDVATETLVKAISEGNARLALALLKDLGVLTPLRPKSL